MIVRNEKRVLRRCLDAAGPIVDAVSLCDTGSDDGTPEIATAWLAERSVPGRVHRHVFRNFGRNRTLAAEAARRTMLGLGWDLETSYLLFLDADMVLEIAPSFRAKSLGADVYRVFQRNGRYLYPNVRLVRASLLGRFLGATHEFFQPPPGTRQRTLETLSIDDRSDGGFRAQKLERDRRLLLAELRARPRDTRAMFYLAQTFRDRLEWDDALRWYRKRIGAAVGAEEVWYSHYASGLIQLRRGDTRAAVSSLHRAIRLDPSRAEPYYYLAGYLAARGRFLFAARLARRGAALPMPRNRSLFLEPDVYRWGLLSEFARLAYFTRLRDAGLEVNERLVLGAGTPADAVERAKGNAVLYARPLPDATYLELTPKLPAGYLACNPSILRTTSGYLVNCRAVSYRLDESQRYHSRRPDGALRTRNFLLRTDRSLRSLEQQELRCRERPLRPSHVRGLEDCRIFRLGGSLAATCTTAELHPAGPARMSLVRFDRDLGLVRHLPLTGYRDALPQKNWLPFVEPATGDLQAVYGLAPFVTLRIDPASGVCEPTRERAEPRPFGDFRGSAGPVDLPRPLGGGRLLLVHEVAFHGIRYYLHRFMLLDRGWRVTRVSRPFFFHHRGIEFASGACVAHGGRDLLVTLGVEDREAWICRVSLRSVLASLRPLPDAEEFPGSGEVAAGGARRAGEPEGFP